MSLLNCKLWSLQRQHSRKQQNLSYLSYKERSSSLVLLKIPFYVGQHVPKTSIAIFFEKVSLSKYDLWPLQQRHSRKQQNLSYVSHKEKSTSLVLLKIPFYIRQAKIQNFYSKFFFSKGVVLKLWSLISPERELLKTTESGSFEP